MAETRTVSVRLKADTKSYTSSMGDAARSTDKMDAAQTKAQRNADRWKAVGNASTLAGAAMAAGLLYAAKAASNQEQALGSLNAVFKDSGAAMEANARSAHNIGLSTTQYAEAASKLGAQLRNLGVPQSEVAGMTDDLILKAADLAAQFGGPASDAVDALGAAMRGEADPAERYGLALNITAVNAKMASTGLDKAGAMMALLNEQMEKSGTVGAWNREADTMAAQTQKAQAAFDDATAAIGKGLLPILAKVAGAAGDALQIFNSLPGPVKDAVTVIASVGAAALILGPRVSGAFDAIKRLGGAVTRVADPFSTANTKMGKFGKIAAGVTGILGAAAIAYGVYAAAQANAKAKAEELKGTLDETGASTEATRVALAKEIEFNFDFGDLEDTPFTLEEITNAAAEGGPAFDALRAKVAAWVEEEKTGLGALNPAQVDRAEALLNTVDAANRDAQAARDLAQAEKQAGDAAEGAADSSMTDAEAKEAQAAAVKKATAQYEAYIQAVQTALGLLSARDALIGQEDRLTKAIKKNGDALKGRTKEAAANRAAMATEVTNITDLVQSTYESTKAKKGEKQALIEAERVRKQQVHNLIKSAEAAGYDKAETRALIKQLGLLKPVSADVSIYGVSEATKQVRELVRQLGRVAVKNSGLGVFGFGHAAGGLIRGPGTGTSDSIPANLSNGEYVLRASAVARIGADELDRINYAKGGRVGKGKQHHTVQGPAGRGGSGGPDMGFGAATKAIDKWTERVADSKDKVKSLKDEAKSYAESVSEGILASAGGGLFDMFKASDQASKVADLAQAQDQLAEASRKVYDAQVAVNTASPEDRAAAIAALADAQRDLADAQTTQAEAQTAADKAAPTPGNILGRMQERANIIGAYASKVKTLMGKGLSMALIKELAGADMLEAGPVLDALLKMTPEQLKELGALDTQARAAADSIGQAAAASQFGGAIGQAEIQLGADQKGLKDAIKDADKTVDKKWRKQLAKIGLSAEERVQFMQSLRNNDGKLTRHWRSILAKAGLGSEERAELVDGITGADATTKREWRDKLHHTGLSAEEKDDLATQLANAKNPGRNLHRYWMDELHETGLTAKESSDLYDEIIDAGENPSRNMQKEWRKKLMATGLTAREADDLVGKITATTGTVNTEWTGKTHNTALGAHAGPLGTDIDTKGKAKVKADWEDKVNNTALGGQAGPLDNDIRNKAKPKVKSDWEDITNNTALGGQAGPLDDDIKNKAKPKVKSEWEDLTFTAKLSVKLAVKEAENEAAKAARWVAAFQKWQKYAQEHGAKKAGPAPTPDNLGRWGKAKGGLIVGRGTGTSDTAGMYALSNGEYVVRAASVRKYGAEFFDAINVGRYADGGPVGFRTTTTANQAGSRGVTLATSNVPVIVQIDSRAIATGQLKLQRQSGGTVTLGG